MHDSDRDPTARLTRRELLTSTVTGALATAALGTGEVANAQFEPPAITKELWQWVRVQPVTDVREAWMNTASIAPTLRMAMASEYRAREIQSNELPSFANGSRWSVESTRLAGRFARFGGCDPDEVLFTRGAGEGLSLVAAGLDLSSGDEVLMTTQEHPAALSPWLTLARRRGIVVKQVALPAQPATSQLLFDAMAAGFTERTRVLVLNHVQYADGIVMPVRELCFLARTRNVVSVVNGSQAFGAITFQLHDLACDFYATGFHKWLAGSQGSGLLFARREMQDRVWPTEPRGFDASPPISTPTRSAGNDDVPAALHRFGNVVPQLWPALRGSEAALDFQEQVNRARIEARMRELVLYARMRLPQVSGVEILTPSAPGMWAGILTFRMPGRIATEVAGALARINRVHVAALNWPASADALRLSLHIFNSHDEIDRLIGGLQQLPKL
ncbi:MAG TPA: aminotransferase class V-fold PLP-dependent enzyme [Povalibacter sp.]|uniref:aminotransferase class V-fold PLP-dependent enzyme n=1 Tax=Povalibacter sp. TaxID=1962978 RepID=UPI002D1C7441|nr:aminotransferase class V-fold PLP-dependent enzyme [Povalibacter sp.]HMN47315.1 aminotransferase class V-fold PLP-dependent enzyme [Povalibacter sp.]